MRLLKLMLIAICFSQSVLAFPEILGWKNYPTVVFDNKQSAKLVKNTPLKFPFAVSTSSTDNFEFLVNSFDRVLVYPNSRLQILEFGPDGEFVPDLFFLGGKLRFNSSFRSLNKKDTSLVLKTPFFELQLEEPADFIVELDMKTPSVEIKMIKGVLPLEFFAYEKKVVLEAGQSVKFTGEPSADKAGIGYDYLLNKRKVPKGALAEVKKFDQTQFLHEELESAQKEVKQKKAAERKVLEKKQKQQTFENSFLCKNPYGQKDQCAWRIENGACFRERCNVQGQWGDKTPRPIGKNCKKQVFVSPCDY